MIFEWDEEKARANLKKHKVTFDEAESVFYDPLSITIPDPDHSLEEYRFIDIGTSETPDSLLFPTRKEKSVFDSSLLERLQKLSEKCMKKKNNTNEMRSDYDFSDGVRGKHFKKLQNGHTTVINKRDGSTIVRETRPVILAPDVQAYFPNTESVNQALRGLIALIPEKHV